MKSATDWLLLVWINLDLMESIYIRCLIELFCVSFDDALMCLLPSWEDLSVHSCLKTDLQTDIITQLILVSLSVCNRLSRFLLKSSEKKKVVKKHFSDWLAITCLASNICTVTSRFLLFFKCFSYYEKIFQFYKNYFEK